MTTARPVRPRAGKTRSLGGIALLAAVVIGVVAGAQPARAGACPPATGAAVSYAGWVEQLRATAAFGSPAGRRYASIDRAGTTVLPSGRLLTPAGTSTVVGGHPYGLLVAPDGRTAVTSNSGSVPFTLSVVTAPGGPAPVVRTVTPRPTGAGAPTFFMGLARSADGRTLYASGGSSGTVQVVDLVTATVTSTVDLNVASSGRPWQSSFLGDLVLNPDGSQLYVVDQANFRLVEVSVGLTGLTVGRSLPTGRYPFSVALSPDGQHAWVANTGEYQYEPVRGYDPTDEAGTALHFPPFGAPTTASLVGAVVEGKQVPALGDPNHASAASVWDLDLQRSSVAAMVKTGPLVGEKVAGVPAIGTSGPNALVTDGRRVYVSNGHSDTVAVVDATSHRVLRSIALRPSAAAATLRGVQPFGLALSSDAGTLFVAESGLNAVAVIDTANARVLGHIPTGWLPSKVAVTGDGRTLFVTNARGFGNGANAALGKDPITTGAGRLGATISNGTLETIGLPDLRSPAGQAQLAAWTAQVLVNDGLNPVRPGMLTRGEVGKRPAVPIQHVVIVVKENRTYDQVLGDVGPVSNRTPVGDATLADAPDIGYGEHATAAGSVDPTRPGVVRDVDVTPNQHALARSFAFSDNNYADGDVSADGHRWLVGVQPDAFVESSYPQSYGMGLSYGPQTGPNPAPGRRGVTGTQAALAPEEYAEAGSIWDNLTRSGKTFYNFGEGLELADTTESAGVYPGGAYYGLNTPLPAALFGLSAKDFPEFNTTISDQYREDIVEQHLRHGDLGPAKGLPGLTFVWLPQDHGGTPNAALGYPYLQSFPADNDLALGRLVDTLSHRKEWPSTAIIVLEDDAQGGFDSVDAHRTIGMVISPWAKRSFVSDQHTSTTSMVKTVDLLLGLPMLNQDDATSTDLLDLFTDTYQPQPYTALPSDARLFDPAKVTRVHDGLFAGPPTSGSATSKSDGDQLKVAERDEPLSLSIDDEAQRPAGQPGGAVVTVGGVTVDQSSRAALTGLPPRAAPVSTTVTGSASCRPTTSSDLAGGLPTGVLAATGLAIGGLLVRRHRHVRS